MVTRWWVSTSLVRFPTINWRSGVNGVNGARSRFPTSSASAYSLALLAPGGFLEGNLQGKSTWSLLKIVCQRKPLVFSSAISEYPRYSISSYYIAQYDCITLCIPLYIPMKTITHSISHILPWYQAFHQAVLDCMGFSNGPGPWNDHKKPTKKPTKGWSKMGNSHENHETYGKSYGKSYGNIIFQWGNPLFWCWKSIVQGHGLPWRCAAERIPSRYPLWPQRNGSLNHGFLGDLWGMELGKVCSARDMKWYETPMLLFGEPNS